MGLEKEVRFDQIRLPFMQVITQEGIDRVITENEKEGRIVSRHPDYWDMLINQEIQEPYCPEFIRFWKEPDYHAEHVRLERVPLYSVQPKNFHGEESKLIYLESESVCFKARGYHTGVLFRDEGVYVVSPAIIGVCRQFNAPIYDVKRY